MIRNLFVGLVIAAISVSTAHAGVPTGVVVPNLRAADSPDQTYALYLPKAYTPQKKWPLLLVFDPAARGELAVNVFREAAEKYGYVVMASNVSRNGPWRPQLQAFEAMAKESGRFSIDLKQVYAAGFSGGARVAAMVAYRCNGCIKAVILCGAGLPQGLPPSVTPVTLGFDVFGMAGLYDFNFGEVRGLVRDIRARGGNSHFEVFEGDHQWPIAAVTDAAFQWLELRAMASQRKPADAAFVEQVWTGFSAKAAAAESAQRWEEAQRYWTILAQDFGTLHDAADAKTKLAQINASKELQSQLERAEKDLKEQEVLFQPVLTLVSQLPQKSDEERGIAAEQLFSALEQLRQKMRNPKDDAQRVLYRRAATQAAGFVWENGEEMLRLEKPLLAGILFEAISKVVREPAEAEYRSATAYARAGENKAAMRLLRSALSHGLAERERLRTDPDLAKLRKTADFRSLID